jgi:hypothetical protein
MPAPRLLHPVPVLIRQIDRKFTSRWDDNLHEPIGQVRRKDRRKETEVRAQVKIGGTDTPQASEGGVVEKSDGYLLFLTSDLKKAHLTINRGDRVVKIGNGSNGREVDLYITQFEWRGHYPGAQGPTLLKAHFEDRAPSRQRGDL